MIKDLIHSPNEEEKQKHTPNIVNVHDNRISVTCGKDIMHPSTEAHNIAWIKLFGIDKEDKFRELGSFSPAPGIALPLAVFDVKLPEYKELQALIYCNLHGLWQNTLKL